MMKASKSQLRDEIRGLRFVGARMSNVCFNLGQDGSTIQNRRILAALAKNWDDIPHAEGHLRRLIAGTGAGRAIS